MSDFLFVENVLKNWYLIHNSSKIFFRSSISMSGDLFIHTRVIFYVRRIGPYLYKYRIYGTISIYILKALTFVYQLI